MDPYVRSKFDQQAGNFTEGADSFFLAITEK